MRAVLADAMDVSLDGFAVLDVEVDRDLDDGLGRSLGRRGAVAALRVVAANPAAIAAFGGQSRTGPGTDLLTVVEPQFSAALATQVSVVMVEGRPRCTRIQAAGPGGDPAAEVVWEVVVSPVTSSRVGLTVRDVTVDQQVRRAVDEQRRQAEYEATHDPMTGLANRALLLSRLATALDECPPDQRVVVVFCDLDAFKQVNDTYGHAAGDAVLIAAARRLEAMVRDRDTVARLGGDEFVVVLRDLPGSVDPDLFVSRSNRALLAPVAADGLLLFPSASLGAVVVDPCASAAADRRPEAVLAAADRAMYTARTTRRHLARLPAPANTSRPTRPEPKPGPGPGPATTYTSDTTQVALLDRRGVIVAVNPGWQAFARDNDADPARSGIGMSYLDVCAAAGNDPFAHHVASAIRAALAGDLAAPLTTTGPCHRPGPTPHDTQERWYDVFVSSRLDDNSHCLGAVIAFVPTHPPHA